jgi:putative phosphoserine phosphatase/1-acylglycerol-3-phosphate O-acyltransferase
MQAGVPIIPIVIHNATDVAPKNEFVMRPATVRVTVLPPIDTSGWKASGLNGHVTDVRNMFLRTLGQPEETMAEAVAKREAAKAPKARATTRPKVKPAAKAKDKPAAQAKPVAKPVPVAKPKPAPPRKGRAG